MNSMKYIFMHKKILIKSNNKEVKFVTVVEGDQKAPFSIATTVI